MEKILIGDYVVIGSIQFKDDICKIVDISTVDEDIIIGVESERPWELWECTDTEYIKEWFPCVREPRWQENLKYRRKETKKELVPEYFSGLNWREAEKYLQKSGGFRYRGNMEKRDITSHTYRLCSCV